jgi:hypothetical protein
VLHAVKHRAGAVAKKKGRRIAFVSPSPMAREEISPYFSF